MISTGCVLRGRGWYAPIENNKMTTSIQGLYFGTSSIEANDFVHGFLRKRFRAPGTKKEIHAKKGAGGTNCG